MANFILLNNGVIPDNPYGITQFTGATQSTDHIGKTLTYGSSQTGTQDVTCTTNGSIDWSKYSQVIITYAMNFENRSGFTGDANGYVYIGSTPIISRNRTQSTGAYITQTIDITSYNATETMAFRTYLRKTNTFGVGASSDVNIKTIELVPNLEVTTSVSPAGSGSVTGDGFYPSGTSVTVTATPNPNYQFSYFLINGVSEPSNPYTFTIAEDTTVIAYFTSLGHDVTLLVDPAGYGSVTGAGSYPQGASVTIEATPNTHKLFVNWTENGVEVSANPSYTFTMGASDVTYTANFTDARLFTVKATPDPATLPLIYQSSEEVYEGESVILKAREVDGYVFSHWSNGSLDNPLVLTPTENTEIVAYYLPYSKEDDGNYRAYIKDMTSVNTVPKANISVQSFTIKRDLLTSAVSTINALEVPANISNGDILVLYDPTGKIVYQGIVEMIEDASIQCRQIQSFYKGLWIYDTDTSESTIEGEIASLLNDYAQGKIKGSTYTDSLIATEKEPLMISATSSTSGNIETKEGTTDMETFIYDLYRDYGLLIDFDIPYGAWTIGDPNGGTAKISIPNYSTIKVGNNTESVTNLTPITEIAETNKLIVFSKSGTYRSTFVYTSTNGIVEEPVTDVGRYGVINTKVVYSDDNIDDIVKANLPQTMYNHHLTFDLLSVSKLYKFDDFRLGQPIDVWNGTDYYSTVLTGYEFTKEANQPVQSVHMICGKVRISLTSKLLLGVFQ